MAMALRCSNGSRSQGRTGDIAPRRRRRNSEKSKRDVRADYVRAASLGLDNSSRRNSQLADARETIPGTEAAQRRFYFRFQELPP